MTSRSGGWSVIGSSDGCTAAVCRCPTFAGNTTDHSCNLQLKIIKFKCHIDNGIKICALMLHYIVVFMWLVLSVVSRILVRVVSFVVARGLRTKTRGFLRATEVEIYNVNKRRQILWMANYTFATQLCIVRASLERCHCVVWENISIHLKPYYKSSRSVSFHRRACVRDFLLTTFASQRSVCEHRHTLCAETSPVHKRVAFLWLAKAGGGNQNQQEAFFKSELACGMHR